MGQGSYGLGGPQEPITWSGKTQQVIFLDPPGPNRFGASNGSQRLTVFRVGQGSYGLGGPQEPLAWSGKTQQVIFFDPKKIWVKILGGSVWGTWRVG